MAEGWRRLVTQFSSHARAVQLFEWLCRKFEDNSFLWYFCFIENCKAALSKGITSAIVRSQGLNRLNRSTRTWWQRKGRVPLITAWCRSVAERAWKMTPHPGRPVTLYTGDHRQDQWQDLDRSMTQRNNGIILPQSWVSTRVISMQMFTTNSKWPKSQKLLGPDEKRILATCQCIIFAVLRWIPRHFSSNL